MRRSPLVVAFVVLLTVSTFAGVAVAQDRERTSGYGGQPNLNVLAPSPTVSPGEQPTLTLQVTNRGEVTTGVPPAREAVTTARNVRIEANASDTPLVVRSGKQSVGSVTENQPRNAPVELEVPEGVEPGTYELEVELAYSYTDRVIPTLFRTSERTRTVTRTVDVVVEGGPQFDVRTLETDAQVGGSGTATVVVRNVGTEPASDISVALESRSPRVTFEDSPTAFATVGRLAPGQRGTARVGVDFDSEASVRPYPLTATVTYDDADGFAGTDDGSLQVRPLPEQTVSVENVSSTLRVGEEGTLRATVVNEGPADLDSAVVTLQPPAENVEVVEPEAAVGDLAGGESTSVTFDVELASAAREGTRQFSLETEYEGADGEVRSVDPVRFRASVGPQRDVFDVETRNATVTAGGTNRIVLAVTNQRNETVTDVSAKLFASAPLSAADDEAYVAALDPGETVEIPFRVGAGGDALAKTYPVAVDFQYVDAGGESRLSESYRRPVTVRRDGGGGLLSTGPLGVLVAVSLLVPAALLARRR